METAVGLENSFDHLSTEESKFNAPPRHYAAAMAGVCPDQNTTCRPVTLPGQREALRRLCHAAVDPSLPIASLFFLIVLRQQCLDLGLWNAGLGIEAGGLIRRRRTPAVALLPPSPGYGGTSWRGKSARQGMED